MYRKTAAKTGTVLLVHQYVTKGGIIDLLCMAVLCRRSEGLMAEGRHRGIQADNREDASVERSVKESSAL